MHVRGFASAKFILGLGLMCGVVQKLPELILDLKEHDMNLYKANTEAQNIVKIIKK